MSDEPGSDGGPAASDDRESRVGPDDPGSRADRDEPLGDLAERVRERAGDARGATDRDQPTREGPLSDVATRVDERRRRDDRDDAFESVAVDELDGEKLWERLADEDGDAPTVTVPPGERVAIEDDARDDRDVRTVPKETCHGCPHFGRPPELACTHEGTDILAMPDVDHFRVADCPMVGEEEELGTIAVDRDPDGGEPPEDGAT